MKSRQARRVYIYLIEFQIDISSPIVPVLIKGCSAGHVFKLVLRVISRLVSIAEYAMHGHWYSHEKESRTEAIPFALTKILFRFERLPKCMISKTLNLPTPLMKSRYTSLPAPVYISQLQ